MSHRGTKAAVWLAITGALASCGDGTVGDAAGMTVTDSAGVEIVHSGAPAWQPGGSWTVSERPRIAIGEVAGDEAYTLYSVRAAVRLADGRIAIANGGTAQVRIYDGNGRHLRDIGRRGEGPGEFQLLMDLWPVAGDSIVAADNRLGRLTLFDSDGRIGRTLPLQPNGDARQVFGRRPFRDGSLLVSGVVAPSERPKLGLFDGGTRVFERYSSDGTPLKRIGTLPQGPNWGFELGGGVAYTSAPFSIFSPPHASDGERVYLGAGTAPEVEQRSAAGDVLRIIRWAAEPRPVDQEMQTRFRERRLEGANTPDSRQSAQSMLDGLVFPEALPVYDALLTDEEGHLWVKQYRPTWEEGPRWWIFDPSGRWLGEPRVPTGLQLLSVGRDYVLGLVRDENGVERVVLHDLTRVP